LCILSIIVDFFTLSRYKIIAISLIVYDIIYFFIDIFV
jgi:hypothetical protein